MIDWGTITTDCTGFQAQVSEVTEPLKSDSGLVSHFWGAWGYPVTWLVVEKLLDHQETEEHTIKEQTRK